MRRWRWLSCSIVLSRRKNLRRRRRKRNRFGCPERKGRIAPAFFISGAAAKSGGERQPGTERCVELVPINVGDGAIGRVARCWLCHGAVRGFLGHRTVRRFADRAVSCLLGDGAISCVARCWLCH